MSLMIDSGLAHFFSFVTGMTWPEADEDKLRQVGGDYHALSKDLTDIQNYLNELVKVVLENFEGDAADAFVAAMRRLTGGSGGDDYLSLASQTASELGDQAVNTANQVEYTKAMTIAQLVQLFASFVFASMWAPFTFGASWGPFMVEWRAVAEALKQLFLWLLKTIAMHEFMSIAGGLVLDGIIQGIQIGEGHKSGYDSSSAIQAIEYGAINGALAPLLDGVGGVGSKLLGGLLGKGTGSLLGGEIKDLIGGADRTLGPLAASNFAKDVGNTMGQAVDQLVAGFGKADSAAVETFTGKLGQVFEKHLGDTLGEGAGYALGKDFGRDFAANWGRQGAEHAGLDEALQKLLDGRELHGLGDQLGALAHGLPGVLDHLHPNGNLLYQLGETIGEQLKAGLHNTLTEGLFNLVFGPDHQFTVTGASFGAGVGMGLLGKGMHLAVHHLTLPGLRTPLGQMWTNWVRDWQHRQLGDYETGYFGPLHPLTLLSMASNLSGTPAPFPVPRLGPGGEVTTADHVVNFDKYRATDDWGSFKGFVQGIGNTAWYGLSPAGFHDPEKFFTTEPGANDGPHPLLGKDDLATLDTREQPGRPSTESPGANATQAAESRPNTSTGGETAPRVVEEAAARPRTATSSADTGLPEVRPAEHTLPPEHPEQLGPPEHPEHLVLHPDQVDHGDFPSPDNAGGNGELHLPSGGILGAEGKANGSAQELLDVATRMHDLGVLPDGGFDGLKDRLQPIVDQDLAKGASQSVTLGAVKGRRPPTLPSVVPADIAEQLLDHLVAARRSPLGPEQLNRLGVEATGSIGPGGTNDPADLARVRDFLTSREITGLPESPEDLADRLLMEHLTGGLDGAPGRAGRRVSSLLEGLARRGTTMAWKPSGQDGGTDFAQWAREGAPKDDAPQFSETTSANCWEAVMLAGFHEGALSSEWIAETYQAKDTGGMPWHQWLVTRLLPHSRSLYAVGTKEPRPGQVVVMDADAKHVAIVVEGRGPDGMIKLVGLGWPSELYHNGDENVIGYASIDDLSNTIYFGDGPFGLPDNSPLTTHDGSLIQDSQVRTHQLADPTGKSFGRAAFPETDWQHRKDLYQEITGLLTYEQRPEWSTPTGRTHEVPWDPKNVYVFADHHDAQGFRLETDGSLGQTPTWVDGAQLGGLLNRRPSLADLKRAQESRPPAPAKPASILLLSCDSAAHAQAVADRTGMVVHAPNGRTGLVGKDLTKPYDASSGAVLYVKPTSDGEPGVFRTFRPGAGDDAHGGGQPGPRHLPEPSSPSPDNGPDGEGRVVELVNALMEHQLSGNHLLDDGTGASPHAAVLSRFPQDDRFFTVAMHTGSDGTPVWRGEQVPPGELAQTLAALHRNGVWDGVKPLQLPGCDLGTGRGESYAARTLAELRKLLPDAPLKAYVPEGTLYFTPSVQDGRLDQQGSGHLVVAKGVVDKFGRPSVVTSPETGWLELTMEPHGTELHIAELGAHLPVDGSMPPNSQPAPDGYGHIRGSRETGGALPFGRFGRKPAVVTGVEAMEVARHPLDTPRHAEGDRTKDPFDAAVTTWQELADHRRELAELKSQHSEPGPDHAGGPSESQERIDKLQRDLNRRQANLRAPFEYYLRADDRLLTAGAARREKEIAKLRNELSGLAEGRDPQWQVEHARVRLTHLESELLDIQGELNLRPARARQDMVVSARDLQLVEELRAHGGGPGSERLDQALDRARKLAESEPTNPLYGLDLSRARQDVELFDRLTGRADWHLLDPASVAALVLAERKGRESDAREHALLVANLRGAKGEWAWAKAYPTGTDQEVNALIDTVTRHMHEGMGVATNYLLDDPPNSNRNLKDAPMDGATLLDLLIEDPEQLFRNTWETGASQAAPAGGRRGAVEEWMSYSATLNRSPDTRHRFQDTESEQSVFAPPRPELLPKYGALVSTARQPRGVGRRYGAFVLHWKPELRGRVTHTPRDSWSAGRLGARSFTSDSHLLPLLNHGDPEQVKFTVGEATGFRYDSQLGSSADTVGLLTDAYFETQIHGPLHWRDLDRITINYQGATVDPENTDKLPTMERAEQVKARIEDHARKHGYHLTVDLRPHDAPPSPRPPAPDPELPDPELPGLADQIAEALAG